VVLARVRNQLELRQARQQLKHQNDFLEQEINRRMHDNQLVQDVSIRALAHLAETRDLETGKHLRRVQEYIRLLAEQLRSHPRFAAHYTELLNVRSINLIAQSAPLHDIGKVGIPDAILLKPGKLTVEEFEIMKTHTTIGYDALVRAEALLPTQNSFLQCAKEIALSHQEKWDGSGYPQGLKGDEIPISARLMAVADVYDALISRRYYKDGMAHEVAVDIIAKGAGQHFDPDIAAAFLEILPKIKQIADSLADD
jgi:putative two-component system response regulator